MSGVTLVIGYFVTVFLLVAGFLILRRRQSPAQQPPQNEQAPARQVEGVREGRGRQAEAQAQAVERKAVPTNNNNNNRNDVDEGDVDAEGDEGDQPAMPGAGEKLTKAAKKQMNKSSKKTHRDDERRAREAKEEAKKQKEDKRREAQTKKQEEREAAERAQEEALAKLREAEQKKQDEEYQAWQGSFTVEQGGSQEEDAAEAEGLLGDFIEYIRSKKVVNIDELADEFKLKTQDVVNRIEALEKEGSLTGILDDRGKFIFITPEEMEAVAAFIKRKGRVNISDVVSEANKIIDLTGRKQKQTEKNTPDKKSAAVKQS